MKTYNRILKFQRNCKFPQAWKRQPE